MKKVYLLVSAIVMIAMLPATLSAQDIILSEGFENGIPSDWIQESVSGQTLWAVETAENGAAGLEYPNGAYGTGKSRAYLRNTTGQTLGFKTRLITPVMNIEYAKNADDDGNHSVYQPILRFSHAQAKWTADFDTLRVYYRTSQEERARWILLREYTRPYANWVREEIELPQANTTYQIAFEGSDNMGRGIVLDSVVVRSKPECTTPHDLELFNMVDGGIDLQWIANYDSYAFQFVVMKGEALNYDIDTVDLDNSSMIVYNEILEYEIGEQWVHRISGLEGGTTYTVYIRSLCEGGEFSDWESVTFNMKNVKAIPYYESFNLPLNPGTISKLSGWTMTGNTGNFNPHICTNLTGNDARHVTRSGTSLVFTGKNNSYDTSKDGEILAGEYVYAATPELTGADLQDCQVRFWMTLGAYGCFNDYARSIIVGVMTDPQDLETFEPVDTVSAWRYATWEEHIVSLENISSAGKFVAFLSNFDKPNKLYIEDMTVEIRPALQKVQGVNAIVDYDAAHNRNYKAFWNGQDGVQQYKVLLADVQSETPDSIAVSDIIKTYQCSATEQIISASDIEAGDVYYLYVQAVQGTSKGEWSNGYKFEVPCQRAIPMIFDFEPESGESQKQNPNNLSSYYYADCLGTYSTDPEYPYTYKASSTYMHTPGGKGILCLSKQPGRDAWVTLPPVERVDTMELEFYMRAYSTSYRARAVVGIMTDPADIETFEPMAVFENTTTTYIHCITPFASYKGSGHYIAVRWQEASGVTVNNYMYIDDMELHYIGDCVMPGQLDATEVESDRITVEWEAPRMDTWDVVVSSALLTDDQVDDDQYMNNVLARKNDLKESKYSISGLKWGHTYYFYVRSVCDRTAELGGTSYWAGPYNVTTAVPDPMPLPYLEDFEDWAAGSPGYLLPAGWTKNSYGNYPYVYNSSTYNHTSGGLQSLYLYNYSSKTSAISSLGGIAVLPKLDMQDLTDLKITFWGRASTAATTAAQASTLYVDSLYIGVMTNPNDTSTFTLLKEVSVPTTTYSEYSTVLDNWNPAYGNYVAITTRHCWSPRATNPTTGAAGTLYNTLYIDDIEFTSFTDTRVISFDVTDIQGDKLQFEWVGRASESGWVVIAASQEINPDTLNKVNPSVIIKNDTLSASATSYILQDLTPQTWYYVYIKPVNAKGIGFWAGTRALTLCLPLTPTKSYMMDFEYLPDSTASAKTLYVPECWTAYNSVSSASNSYIPGIYRYSITTNITATSNCRPGGRKSMCVYTYIPATPTATSGGPAVFASPEINVNDMASLYVSFWLKAYSSTYTSGFGVMKDPDDISTYTELAVIYPGNTNWAQYEFVLGDLGYTPEMGKYVAWVADLHLDKSTARYAGCYIDDIQMYEQTCKNPQVNISQISDTSAIVMTGLPSSSVIQYVLFKDTVVDVLKLNDPTTGAEYLQSFVDLGKVAQTGTFANGAGQILYNLDESTEYVAALQMLCDEGATSAYVINSFVTQCAAKQLSYFENIDFERVVDSVNIYNDTTYASTSATWAGGARPIDCWTLGNKALDPNNKTAGLVPYVIRRTAAQTNTTIVPNGWNALRFYSTTTNNGAYAIMPTLDTDDIRGYQVSFKGRANGGTGATKTALSATYAGGIIVGIVSDASDLSTFIAIDTIYVQDTAVHQMAVRFDKYKGDADGNMGKQVAFMSEFAKTNVFIIDDISVSEVDAGCQIPLHLRANPNVYDAELSWEAQADSFYVYISEEPVAKGNWDSYSKWLTVGKTNKESVQIEGLKGSKAYYAYIKALCSDTSIWALDPLYFKTECPVYLDLPYYENFDSYSSGTTIHPDCWDAFYNGLNLVDNPTSTIYPYVYSSANNNSKNGLYFYYYGTYNTPEKRPTTATPKIAGKIGQTMISFDYRNTSTTAVSTTSDYTAYLILGVATETSSLDSLLSTFVPFDTLAVPPYTGANAVWKEYSRELSDVEGENMHIVLAVYNPWGTGSTYHGGQGGSVYVENLKVEKIPSCFTPKVASVTEIGVTSCKVTITAAKPNDSAWDIRAISEDETDTIMVSVTDNETLLSGLTPGTTYNIYARTNCGDGDVSSWSDPLMIYTKALITGEAFYGFENSPIERSVRSPLSTSDSYQLHPDLKSYNMSSAGVACTSYSYYPYNYQQTGATQYVRTGTGVLRFYNYSTTATGASLILPQIVNAGQKQLRMDIRMGYSTAGDSILETNTYYRNSTLEIGMVDAGAENYDSYEVLAEFKTSPLFLHDKLLDKNNKLFDQIVFPIPDVVTADKQIVLRLRAFGTSTGYMFIDNLHIENQTQNVVTPHFSSSAITATSLTLNWNKNGAEKWNVYVVKADAAINFPLDSVDKKDIVDSKLGVTDTTVTFTALTPGARYYAYLQLADYNGLCATSPRRYELMPLDIAISTKDTIDFENNLIPLFGVTATAADSAYQTIAGWYMGNETSATRANQADIHSMGTYWTSNSRSSTYQYVRYSHNNNAIETRDAGKSALRFYTTATTVGAYAVMPKIDCDMLDTLQINFWGRPFYGTSVAAAPKVGVSTSGASTRPLILGTMTDPNDPTTFEKIISFVYPDESLTTSTNLFDDNEQWYREFNASLKGTEGKYIAFKFDTVGYWFIDDITFSAATCFTPTALQHAEVTNHDATLQWKTFVDAPCRVQVATSATYASNAMIIDTLVAEGITKITVNGLDASTEYVWRVRSECGGELSNSKWTLSDNFITDCPGIEAGQVYSFESSEGLIQALSTSTTYMVPPCWKFGTTYTTLWSSYTPYTVASSGTTWYSHATDPLGGNEQNLRGMRFNNYRSSTSSTSYRSWTIMPPVEGNINDMELSFYILPTTYNPQTERLLSTGLATTSSYYYAHTIYIGTVTNPSDISTINIIDTVKYTRELNPSTATIANKDNDFMWQQVNVSLENANGQYIVFLSDVDMLMADTTEVELQEFLKQQTESGLSSYVYNYLLMDDVKIGRKSECAVPTDVSTSEIKKDAALLTWSSDAAADIVSVYTSAQLTEATLVIRDTIDTDTLQLTDLEPFQNYYVSIVGDCGDMQSNPSQTYVFHTLRVPKVTENFMASSSVPTEWEQGVGYASDVFDGKIDITPTQTYAWYHGTALDGIGYPHQYMYMYVTSTEPTEITLDSAYQGSSYEKNAWMITPSIVLDDEHEAWLTFAAFMSGYGSVNGSPTGSVSVYRDADTNGRDDQFMVIVSDDDGETWKRENAVIWNNETGEDNGIRVNCKERNYWYGKGDYSLNDLAVTRTQAQANPIRVDLSKYKGKTIKIAFYTENTLHNARNYIRVSNMNLNYYVIEQGSLTNCQYNEFDDADLLGFNINEDMVAAGAQHYERIVYAPALDADLSDYTGSFLDSLYVLDAEILSAPTYVIEATICEGEEYSEYNFTPRTQTGVYKQKGICTETGCDSITVLNLTVIPRQYAIVEDTICEGQVYIFNGKEYSARTITNDTLTSVVTGCDSIVTLFLEVIPAITEERVVQICSGSTYYLSEKYATLDQSGHYIDTVLNDDGCKLVIDLQLTVLDTLRSSDAVVTCAGEPVVYAGQTFTESGVYPINLQSALGCDSIVTLTVTVLEPAVDTLDIKICQGDSYSFNGMDITVSGQYKQTLTSAAGCDSLVVLNLEVLEVVASYVDTVITVDELPYFYGDVTYPLGTEPGIYYDTISDGGLCSGILYHKLTINAAEGFDNLKANDLRLTPSVINRDETVKVASRFTPSELKGMRIDVYDMTGREVTSTTSVSEPIELNCFHVSGLYNVRITTGTNSVYVGRVVVK